MVLIELTNKGNEGSQGNTLVLAVLLPVNCKLNTSAIQNYPSIHKPENGRPSEGGGGRSGKSSSV